MQGLSAPLWGRQYEAELAQSAAYCRYSSFVLAPGLAVESCSHFAAFAEFRYAEDSLALREFEMELAYETEAASAGVESGYVFVL